jgi:hypothetical protein
VAQLLAAVPEQEQELGGADDEEEGDPEELERREWEAAHVAGVLPDPGAGLGLDEVGGRPQGCSTCSFPCTVSHLLNLPVPVKYRKMEESMLQGATWFPCYSATDAAA